MAKIIPFRGLRYSGEQAGDLSTLITPPYDVIDGQAQRLFYEKNPYNVIRLEYGEIRETDNEQDNRYTRAAGLFERWLNEGVLRHETQPAVYLYEQEYSIDGGSLTRTGLVCGVGVEDFHSGVILPHEETLSKAKADRLELLRHCRANFSPIFGLYDDPDLSLAKMAAGIKEQKPVVDFTDENGEKHRLWLVTQQSELSSIQALFSSKKIYIADGHHRYETSLNYHKEMLALDEGGYNFTLMTLVNLYDPGLVILPTHRLVKNVPGFDKRSFLEHVSRHFSVSSEDITGSGRAAILSSAIQDMETSMPSAHVFSVYLGDGNLYRLEMPRGAANSTMAQRFPSQSASWLGLDVSILQTLVLEDALGINKEARQSGTNLTYTREEAGALEQVDSGAYQAAIFLNPPTVREVIEVAAAGDRMPQKSTYFYPKLVTGLVINDFTI